MHAGVFGVGASAAKRFGLVMARARRQEPDKVQALPRHNMPASTMTAWTTLRKVSAFTLFTTGMESRSPSTAKGHAEKHIVGYFRSVEAGRGLHGAGDQNAQKEVDAW